MRQALLGVVGVLAAGLAHAEESYTFTAIVQKLYDATTQALKSPATVERLKNAGVAPIAPELRTPAYLKTFIASEVDNWAATIKASGVTIE